ncbi:olfactory receptor family 14 protein [Klebsiella pneumoniae]|nr:olfactory receptor family 14 protein [Klebsiella pneumoniae]
MVTLPLSVKCLCDFPKNISIYKKHNNKSISISSPVLNLFLAVLYSVVPPAVNPLIYSMRNQELKEAAWKMMTECFPEAILCPSSSMYDS